MSTESRGLADRLWYGSGMIETVGRTLLWPVELAYRGVVAMREQAYAHRLLATHRAAIPVVSVGNVSVGGTGKTPITSYLAAECLRRGARAGIVLRGYGDDEPAVHELLLPGMIVEADANRVQGIDRAKQRGAQVVVLDDALQHRRIARDVEIVLLSADRPWTTRCLPGGPLREPVAVLSRADLVIVTRKAASLDVAQQVEARARAAGAREVAHVALSLDRLRLVAGEGVEQEKALARLREVKVVAVSGIGDPTAWHQQLAALGAEVTPHAFADHHRYSVSDVERIVRGVPPGTSVVCTLKDAVKLRALWPRSGPSLWYVSQRVEPGDSGARILRVLDRVWPDSFTER